MSKKGPNTVEACMTMLANVANSCMSDEAAQTLKDIDSEAAQAMSAAKLVGVIPKLSD